MPSLGATLCGLLYGFRSVTYSSESSISFGSACTGSASHSRTWNAKPGSFSRGERTPRFDPARPTSRTARRIRAPRRLRYVQDGQGVRRARPQRLRRSALGIDGNPRGEVTSSPSSTQHSTISMSATRRVRLTRRLWLQIREIAEICRCRPFSRFHSCGSRAPCSFTDSSLGGTGER